MTRKSAKLLQLVWVLFMASLQYYPYYCVAHPILNDLGLEIVVSLLVLPFANLIMIGILFIIDGIVNWLNDNFDDYHHPITDCVGGLVWKLPLYIYDSNIHIFNNLRQARYQRKMKRLAVRNKKPSIIELDMNDPDIIAGIKEVDNSLTNDSF